MPTSVFIFPVPKCFETFETVGAQYRFSRFLSRLWTYIVRIEEKTLKTTQFSKFWFAVWKFKVASNFWLKDEGKSSYQKTLAALILLKCPKNQFIWTKKGRNCAISVSISLESLDNLEPGIRDWKVIGKTGNPGTVWKH